MHKHIWKIIFLKAEPETSIHFIRNSNVYVKTTNGQQAKRLMMKLMIVRMTLTIIHIFFVVALLLFSLSMKNYHCRMAKHKKLNLFINIYIVVFE